MVRYDNVVRCWLPRPPKVAEIQHCWRSYVLPELLGLGNQPVLVTCGMPATKFLLKGSTAKDLGSVVEVTLGE